MEPSRRPTTIRALRDYLASVDRNEINSVVSSFESRLKVIANRKIEHLLDENHTDAFLDKIVYVKNSMTEPIPPYSERIHNSLFGDYSVSSVIGDTIKIV